MATKGRNVPETNGKADDDAVVTPASAWRRQAHDGELYRLPGSGNIMRLRRIGLQGMIARAGNVPNPISRQVRTFLSKLGDLRGLDVTDEQRIALYQDNAEAAVALMELALVEPKMVRDREPDFENGEIAPESVPDYDYVWFVYSFLEGDAAALADFRVTGRTGTAGLPDATVRNDADGVPVS